MLSTTTTLAINSQHYPADHTSTSADFSVQESQTSYEKYSNKDSVNLANIKNCNFNLLKEHIVKNTPSQLHNTQLVIFMLTKLSQKNFDLLQISDELHISSLTLKNCLTGKTKTLSRKSFLKILEFYLKQP